MQQAINETQMCCFGFKQVVVSMQRELCEPKRGEVAGGW